MKRNYKLVKILLSILAITILIFASNKVEFASNTITKANINKKVFQTAEKNISTEKLVNGGTLQYSKPSPVYDFFDENGLLNVIYTSEENVYWAKFDENLNITNTIKMPQYFNKDNSSESLRDILYTFGNAIYDNQYLYVVYGREATGEDTLSLWKYATMAVVKYNKNGEIVDTLEMPGAENNFYTDGNYGTYLPFFPNCNCSLTINNGILTCFFGKQMYNAHQSSSIYFVDTETMEWVSNRYYASEENKEKYLNAASYYNSHSLAQRIIPTSDGGYLLADNADASTRGLLISKIYPDENGILQTERYKMIHYREGGTGSHGYNYTYSLLGNIIELSDGYMYIGALEKTLDRNYGNSLNESWNICIQKYKSNFWNEDSVENMQVFDTDVRSATGTPPTDTTLGRLYLDGTEKDYGIKWLTDLENKTTVIQIRAVEMENDKIAILWEEMPMEYQAESDYLYDEWNTKQYYMVIDGNGNILNGPYEMDSVELTPEEHYAYKDGKIYWTSTNGTSNITINVLDINNPIIMQRKNISDLSISMSSSLSYKGSEVKNYITIKDGSKVLEENEDYTLLYKNNINVGTASVDITGIGDYTGTITKTFQITCNHLKKDEVVNDKATTNKDGSITMKCSVCGTITSKNTVYYPKTFMLSSTSYTYSGSEQKPTLTVKDRKGNIISSNNYTVSYSNNKSVGKASVTIKFKGRYTGTVTKTFIIKPKKVTGLKVKSQKTDQIKLNWSKHEGVTGYKVYSYNYKKEKWEYVGKTADTSYTIKKLKAGTTYKYRVRAYKTVDGTQYFGSYTSSIKTTTKTKTPNISKLTTKSKKATIKWKKVSGASGYQIYMATSKNGEYSKIKTITNGTTVSYTKTNLKKNKKYYFKIRAYRTVDGKKVYSSYSGIKSIKIK